MLRGQSLPWRAALHQTPHPLIIRPLLASPRYNASARSILISSRLSRSLPPSRTFSLSSIRRREKPPPGDEKEDPDQNEQKEKSQEKDLERTSEPRRKVADQSGKHGSSTESGAPTSGFSRRKEKQAADKEQRALEEDEKKNSNVTEGRGNSNEPPSPIPASGGPSDSKPSGANNGGNEDGGKKDKKGSGERALQKPSVPDVYPQVMAIPIAKRPLFPGFYKAITIRDPNVAAAIQDMMKRGQPYVGAFLFKDENADGDVIENLDDVYDTGVFAQITAAYPLRGEASGVTAVLYPHRRIKVSSLLPPNEQTKTPAAEDKPAERRGDVVASFEEGTQELAPKDHYEPTSFLRKYPVSLVNVENLAEEPFDKKSAVIRAVTSEIVNVCKEIASLNPLFRDQISAFYTDQFPGNLSDEPAKLADFAAAVSAGELHEMQEVLETMNIEERLPKALVVLKKELMNAQLQSKISKDVEAKIQKRQREYWLMEQMKGIKRELGIESDGKDKLVEKFKEKAEKLAMPEAVKKVFDEEINKLAHLEPAASEFNVTRNYLDWLTQIPWGQKSVENFGIQHAISVLDQDHYGLKDVKDRILEFIAVGKLRGTVEGKILCLVGPPGVGKTSIGKSIARALNRQYYRFSVGGLTDVAEIKGHRRTYVGALPGRIIQALKKCQTENPLILIDEVDKIGRGHQGDPSSALLELLDPEQNSSFLDHYMDVPVDLSKVLFVCTANVTDTIPRPLLDRMELIELSGYVADEKMAIAQRYLAPAARELTGLKDVDVNLKEEAIEELIKSYCRESGVRNLKKQIEKVYRKAAFKIVRDLGEDVLAEDKALTDEGKAAQEESKKDDETPDAVHTTSESEKATTETPRVALKVPEGVQLSIGKDSLTDYVGPPVFTSDRLYDVFPPGVTMGLAWTSMGGAALYVESILENSLTPDSRPGIEITGNLQNVMKESSQIAYSFAKSVLAKQFPENKFFEKARLHMHCPEGAVPKDGPSAGITMASSLLSLALNHPLDPTIAMTGELTVTGKVLRIGGLREKTVAARRAGATKIIFPADNMSDWLELPENIKKGIEGHAVSWYSEVFDLLFPGLDKDMANHIWQKELAKKSKNKSKKEDEDDN
ncbi:ATP-dependent Lon protease pim1 [Aspergillus hancockii]|nr:ATP-dependent Lon protease pim1 [Aspergillus hancockii]